MLSSEEKEMMMTKIKGMMLAQRYEKDAEYAAGAIFMTSLCSIVTIPVILMLL